MEGEPQPGHESAANRLTIQSILFDDRDSAYHVNAGPNQSYIVRAFRDGKSDLPLNHDQIAALGQRARQGQVEVILDNRVGDNLRQASYEAKIIN